MQILKDRRYEMVETHSLHYQQIGHLRGTGFGFPCDAEGRVAVDALTAPGRANYERLRRDHAGYLPPVVETRRHEVKHPAIGRCDCGCRVELDDFTNTCDRCGADYNSAGQRLAPRSQWGEETGEHWADVARVR